MKVRPKSVRDNDPLYHAVLEILREACEQGRVVPSMADMADKLGVTHTFVSNCMAAAEDRGVIQRRGRNSGARVIWLATGAESKPRGRNPAPLLRLDRAPDAKKLEAAKIHLRRFYPNVYDARVIGGPRGHVEVHGVGRLTKEETMALAREKGWCE